MTHTLNQQAVLRQLLSDPETHATTLLTALLDRYGTEALEWSPATMAMELEEDTGAKLPAAAVAKLAVGVALLTTDRFFHDLPFFVTACNVLSGDIPVPGDIDLADAEDCAWGLTEGLLIYPPDEDEPFRDDIRRYLGQVLAAEGIDDPPDILRLAISPTRRLDDLGEEDYQSALERQRLTGEDLTRSIRENLTELFGELERLPLKNGDASKLVEKLRKKGFRGD